MTHTLPRIVLDIDLSKVKSYRTTRSVVPMHLDLELTFKHPAILTIAPSEHIEFVDHGKAGWVLSGEREWNHVFDASVRHLPENFVEDGLALFKENNPNHLGINFSVSRGIRHLPKQMVSYDDYDDMSWDTIPDGVLIKPRRAGIEPVKKEFWCDYAEINVRHRQNESLSNLEAARILIALADFLKEYDLALQASPDAAASAAQKRKEPAPQPPK